MNLRGVTSVEDKGDHFAVAHKTHGSFKVAKRGLDKRTHSAIQAMCNGGAVKGYSGEDGDPGEQVVEDVPTGALGNLNPLTGRPLSETPMGAIPIPVQMPPGAIGDMSPLTGQQIAPAPAVPSQPPPADEVPLGVPQDAALAAALGQNGQAPQSHPQLPKPPGMPSTVPIMKDFDAQAAALRAGALATANEEAEKAKAWEDFNKQSAVRDAAFENTLKARQAEDDALAKDVAAFRIQPHRLWASKTTAQKAANVLGIIIGGLGQGMSGAHSNAALDTINRLVDQDIDAQKLELGQKENQLARNLRSTGDLRTAEQMYRAQKLAGLQGQLQQISARFSGTKAQQNAEYLIGELGRQRDMFNYQIALQRSQMAAGQAQQQQLQDSWTRLMDGRGTPADEAIIGDKLQERIVNTPTGRAVAHSNDSAKEYRSDAAEIEQARNLVSELQGNAKQMALGTLDAKKRGDLATRQNILIMQLPAALASIKRFTENERDMGKDITSNPAEILQLHEKGLGKLNALGDVLDNRLRVLQNTHLIRRPQSKIQAPGS